MRPIVALTSLMLAAAAAASTSAAAQGTAADVQPRLLSVLREQNDAFVRRDTAALRRMLADGYVSVEPDGSLYAADDVIGRAVNNPIDLVVREEVSEPDTRLSANGDTAVLRYRSLLHVSQGAASMPSMERRVTATFLRSGQRWLLARQESAEPARE